MVNFVKRVDNIKELWVLEFLLTETKANLYEQSDSILIEKIEILEERIAVFMRGDEK